MGYNHVLLDYLAVNCTHLSDDDTFQRVKCVICGIPSLCRHAMYQVYPKGAKSSYIMCTSCIELVAHCRTNHFRKERAHA